MRLAYADPPYYGSCKRYGHHHETPYGCWDDLDTHRLLIDRLADYEGWALSATSNSLRHMLPLCPDRVRVLAWAKPFATWKKGVSPAYSWEPVLVNAARKPPAPEDGIRYGVPSDYLVAGNMQNNGFHGGKPLPVCRWIFACMGADPDNDTFDDLFPGSGAVTVAWEHYRTHLTLFPGDRPTQETLAL